MAQEPAPTMPEALPPSLAALLARDDFASTIFESGRCAHSVFESGRCAHSVGAASEWWTASSLALDSLLAALDLSLIHI